MRVETVQKILRETEIGYDTISKKFSETRKHFWRGLEFLNDYTHENDTVLDFGCGNGRLLELLGEKEINYWGVDVSEKLIGLAKEKYDSPKTRFQKINSIPSTIPFETGFFNTVYSIAVFHHFPSKKYRQDVANELYRITKDGGHVVITVWYLWPACNALRSNAGRQKKYFKNILNNWIQKIKGESDLDWNDCEISFTDNQGKIFKRFHRAFTKRELRKLFERAGFKIEKCEVIDGQNIVLVGKKMKGILL